MTHLSPTLAGRADSLVRMIVSSTAHVPVQITGKIGLGKTTLLQGLGERLEQEGLFPIHLSPPLRAEDTGPAIVVQLADGLKLHGLANGEYDLLRDPSIDLSSKMAAVTRSLERGVNDVVLLCDEPREWQRAETDDSDDQYVQRRKLHVLDQVMRLKCRRVFAGSLPEGADAKAVIPHQLPFDGVRFGDQDLGDLEDVAQVLGDRLKGKLAVATSLERRLLVALAKAASVSEAVTAYDAWPDCWTLAKRLADFVSSDSRLAPLREVWARLALFRSAIGSEVLDQVGAHQLEPKSKAILDHGLLQPLNDGVVMHDVLKRLPSELKWQTWHLRQSAHDRFAGYFQKRCDAGGGPHVGLLGDVLEGFHHAASAARPSASQVFKPFFVEQLHTQGKVLSKQCANHAAAANVFEQAILIDDADDYAHHYLAYNLDWQAADEDRTDREYLRAVELNKEHPWWWSRRINFLITTGRLSDAKKSWSDAAEALGLVFAEESESVYRALNLWVARLLLHRGQLEFAQQVLASVPGPVRERDTQFRALDRLLETLREAERGRGVFPWSVLPDRWWHPFPNLTFPPELNGEALMQWNPARVEDVDDENVWLIVGRKRPGEAPTYGHLALPRDRFDGASPDVKSADLTANRFLELAFYGSQGTLQVRCHPVDVTMDRDLPGFDPPDTRRYLKQKLSAP
jgi:tetratricopeptide (TPR) repeat protein